MLLKITDDTIWRRVANTIEDRIKIHNDFDRLENWAKTGKINFNR